MTFKSVGESDYIHLTLAVLQSRIRLQWWRVCVCLSARLGGEWQPLLLLEHQPDELDGRWRFLQDEGCSSRIGYLYCYQWLCTQGKGQKTYVPSLDWGVGPGSRGRLEVGRLQSMGVHLLEIRRTKQLPRSTRLHKLPPRRPQMGWLPVQHKGLVSV